VWYRNFISICTSMSLIAMLSSYDEVMKLMNMVVTFGHLSPPWSCTNEYGTNAKVWGFEPGLGGGGSIKLKVVAVADIVINTLVFIIRSVVMFTFAVDQILNSNLKELWLIRSFCCCCYLYRVEGEGSQYLRGIHKLVGTCG